jgi:hypothetical protein
MNYFQEPLLDNVADKEAYISDLVKEQLRLVTPITPQRTGGLTLNERITIDHGPGNSFGYLSFPDRFDGVNKCRNGRPVKFLLDAEYSCFRTRVDIDNACSAVNSQQSPLSLDFYTTGYKIFKVTIYFH